MGFVELDPGDPEDGIETAREMLEKFDEYQAVWQKVLVELHLERLQQDESVSDFQEVADELIDPIRQAYGPRDTNVMETLLRCGTEVCGGINPDEFEDVIDSELDIKEQRLHSIVEGWRKDGTVYFPEGVENSDSALRGTIKSSRWREDLRERVRNIPQRDVSNQEFLPKVKR
jgi:hypothetical protein